MTNIDGTNNWNLYVNCNTGGGFVALDTFTGTTYHTGTPTGETGRRGSNATGMTDRHQDLLWKNSNGSWVNWVDPSCRFDNQGNNWKGVRDSATEYHTVRVTGGC